MYSIKTNSDLVKYLQELGALKTPLIIRAFQKIDRKDFVLSEFKSSTYENIPLSIKYGQTISQPYTVAFMLELLDVKEGNDILDIGSGSGWTTALLAELTGKTGSVTGLEIIPELVNLGRNNIEKYKYTNAKILQVEKGVVGMPGRKFDRILVSASAQTIQEKLFNQLKDNGILVAPIKNSIFKFTKTDRETVREEYSGFVFVPLKLQIP